MLDDILENKWFSIVILIILIITLFLYYNKKCYTVARTSSNVTPGTTVQGFENLDLSTGLPEITQYPFASTRYAPYGRVNGPFDNDIDDMMKQKLAARGISGGFLPSISERYNGQWNRGRFGVPEAIQWNGQQNLYGGRSRDLREGFESDAASGPVAEPVMEEPVPESIEGEISPAVLTPNDYVCYAKSGGMTLEDLRGTGKQLTPNQYAALYTGGYVSTPRIDQAKQYYNEKKAQFQQAINNYRQNRTNNPGAYPPGIYPPVESSEPVVQNPVSGNAYTPSTYNANQYNPGATSYVPYYQPNSTNTNTQVAYNDVTNDLENWWNDIKTSASNLAATASQRNGTAPTRAPVYSNPNSNPNGCSIM